MAVGNSAGTFQLFGDTSSFPKLISASNSAVVINEDSNDTDFRVEGNGDANLLFVDAGNDRVGIGTSSPSQLFDATATGSTTSVILAQNTTSNNGAAHLRAKNPQNELIIGTDNHSGGLTGTANASFLYTSSTTPIVIMPNGSEKVRIDSSGNVGIGCTDGDITSDGNASRTYVTIQGTANRGRLNLGCTASNGADTATLGFTNGANTVASISSDSDSGSQTAGNIQFATAGSVRASIASSGDVIINHNANNAKLLFRDQSNSTGMYLQQIGSSGSPALRFYDTGANTERLRLDASGNVGIGESSPGNYYNSPLVVKVPDEGGITIAVADTYAHQAYLYFADDDSGAARYAGYLAYDHQHDRLGFGAAGSRRMSLDSGSLGVGVDAESASARIHAQETNNRHAGFFHNTNTSMSSNTLQVSTSRNTTNSSYNHFTCSIHGIANKMAVRDSGAIVSTNNSIGSISDQRMKENIVDAASQWDDIKAVQVRKYNRIGETQKELGVIAQELEASNMGGLVDESEWFDVVANPNNEVRKSVKYSILYMKAVKALQEAMTRIETLETENSTQATQIADLITRVTALEAS
jgi:hypothetical protein